ncbi:winged helix DNA-binding domain-containing protein [Patulibacter americanus]|uniref:winged helix DNA-binding domain-containing protein n=1 Tax=Patulibacter americanus TaxID=588672 RepID=UPI0003B52645|nr:winged helix DNA-binding domain-containing protein [Patulibacter americanus]
MPADEIDPRALNRATLARQMLLRRESVSAVDAIERLGGMQAQDPAPPFVGLWTRLERFDPDELRRALADAEVVRATLLRGTLHLFSRRDYLRYRATLQSMLLAAASSNLRGQLDGLDVDATLAVTRELLEEGPRTQSELRALLHERFPEANDRALGLIARCGAPMVMRPVDHPWSFPRDSAFVLASQMLGAEPDAEERPEELIRRCLAAFGPASATDVRTWCGLPGIAEALEAMRDELVIFRLGRRELFDLPDAPRPGPDAEAPVRYLPEFDNLLLSHADRTRVIADEHRPFVFSKNLRVKATFLVDGRVAGTWSVKRSRKVATLTMVPFGKLAKGTLRELVREGEPLARLAEPAADDADVVVGETP